MSRQPRAGKAAIQRVTIRLTDEEVAALEREGDAEGLTNNSEVLRRLIKNAGDTSRAETLREMYKALQDQLHAAEEKYIGCRIALGEAQASAARLRTERDTYYQFWQASSRGGYAGYGQAIPSDVSEALRYLGLCWPLAVENVNKVRKERARTEHPDCGGSNEAMRRTNAYADRIIQHINATGGVQ